MENTGVAQTRTALVARRAGLRAYADDAQDQYRAQGHAYDEARAIFAGVGGYVVDVARKRRIRRKRLRAVRAGFGTSRAILGVPEAADLSPENIHVVAATSPRSVFESPRGERASAA